MRNLTQNEVLFFFARLQKGSWWNGDNDVSKENVGSGLEVILLELPFQCQYF